MQHGYPVSDILNDEELDYFYSPENMLSKKLGGPDSLKYRALADTIQNKTEKWMTKNFISEWIGEFSKLTRGEVSADMTMESLKAREDEFVNIYNANGEKFDSLWEEGTILKEFLGEANANKYRIEADSARSIIVENVLVDFKDYSLKIVMPGKTIATNGYSDSSGVHLWELKSDYFLTEPYEMWAESKLPNKWAWYLSGLFLIFVITGVVIKIIKKG
jgi:hypothetical protein